jgi:hypothetical protein
MNDIGRVYENIMVCVKGKRKVNPVTRPYCDVKKTLSDFTEWHTIERLVSEFGTLLTDESKFKQAVAFLGSFDKSAFYYPATANRNDYVTSQKDCKQMSRRLANIKSGVKGLLPQNLISFISHNKQSLDMSNEGKGDHNVKHPTVKPIELMEYLLDLMTQPGDVVFDPFMGSGTTGIACKNLERDFIGIELDPEYFQIAQQRIEAAAPAAQNPIVAQPIQPAAKVEENQLRLSL